MNREWCDDCDYDELDPGSHRMHTYCERHAGARKGKWARGLTGGAWKSYAKYFLDKKEKENGKANQNPDRTEGT